MSMRYRPVSYTHLEELKHITAICQKNADGVLWDPVNADSAKHAHYFEAVSYTHLAEYQKGRSEAAAY